MKLKSFVLGILAIGFLAYSLHAVPSRDFHLTTDDLWTLPIAPSASIVELGPHYETNASFVSEVFEADKTFELLGLNWQQALPEGTDAAIEIRFRNEEGEWSDWQPMSEDIDHPKTADDELWSYVITEKSDAFQYRVFLSTLDQSVTPKLSNISFDAVNGGETSLFAKLEKLIFKRGGEVVSREDWGADEDLRLAKNYVQLSEEDDWESELDSGEVEDDPDMKIVKTVSKDEDGEKLLWPLEYPKEIKKFIIHHTATTADLDDAEAAIRAIYYYHSITRGWGDIGYNYLIAPDGTVYEGRAGGDSVVAGHAAGYNTGSVGIALLGNYETSPIPAEMMQSLTDLLYEKSELHGIDPDSSGLFRGLSLPNILGHKDVSKTACPGTYTYEYLDDIRKVLGSATDKRRHSNFDDEFAYEELTDRELITLNPNEKAGVSVKIKNTGTKRWTSGTYLTLSSASGDATLSFTKDSKGSVAKMKESSVDPGKTASFSFQVESGMSGGLAQFDMVPVFNGSEKSLNKMDLAVYVERPTLDFKVKNVDAPTSLVPGQKATVTVTLENTSNLSWKNSGDNSVKLKMSGSSSLTTTQTLATLTESEVKTGETGTFTFLVQAPGAGGKYSLYFTLGMDNSNAFVASSGQLTIDVEETDDDALIVNASSDLSFLPGEKKFVWIQIKNLSDSTWSSIGKKPFSLAFTTPKGFTVSTPRMTVKSLAPGSTTKIYFDVTAGDDAGDYILYIRPRLGSTNLTDNAYPLPLTVEDVSSLADTAYENPIRIKLTVDEASSHVFTSTSTFSVYDGETLLKIFSGKSRVRVKPSDDTFTVTSGYYKKEVEGPIRVVPEEGGILKVLTVNQIPAWDSSINYNEFRGTLEVSEVDDEMVLINELPLEEYLMGLAEETNTTPTEKLKAMAILGRSYAYFYISQAEKFPGMPYNGEDDPATFQKYLGYAYESFSPNIVDAVTATEDLVVTYDGEVVKTPYFSKSDGVATKSAKEVWGWTNTPWLVSVPDPYCDSDAFSGHGVGLSGCGAKTLAEMGKTFEEIIEYYYTGVAISSLADL